MKKNIFLLLVAILFILVLFYFYDKRETVLNKEYYDKNIFINYPYFNDIIIDNYLNDYLNGYINQDDDLRDLLFIDYDYLVLEDRIDLIFYIAQMYVNPLYYAMHNTRMLHNLRKIKIIYILCS